MLNWNIPVLDEVEEPSNVRRRIIPEINGNGIENLTKPNQQTQDEHATKDILSLPKTSSSRNGKNLNAVTSQTSLQNTKRLKEETVLSKKDSSKCNFFLNVIVILSFISMIWCLIWFMIFWHNRNTVICLLKVSLWNSLEYPGVTKGVKY